MNKGSVQIGLYQEWAKQYSVHAELVELTCSEDESLEMLNRGEIDLFLTMDVYGSDVSRHVPICKIGSSDFFFAVNKSRPDLLKDLNFAMNRIQDVYRYYNQQLFNKYFYTSGVNLYLDKDELEWLESHGPIRIGYQDHYLAFCAQDPATGDLTGALSDVLDYASDCLENAHLDFEAVAYPTAEDAMAALQNGEIDCMFPSNLSDYDGELIDVSMTQPLMRTDISAIVRTADHQSFRLEDTVVVAVNEGNPNYDLFLVDHFPHWTAVHYPTTQDCLKAVANGKADCLLISNYRYNNIANLCQKYNLLALSTGVEMDYYFAVRKPDKELFSIMTKMISIVPDASVNAALSHYFTEDARMSVGDFLRQNMAVILAVISAILLVIILLLLRGNRAKQKVKAGQRLISATEIDKLTGLYYNNYFYEYANLLYRENPGRPMDAVVLNIEQFRTINSANGRAFGDQVLRTLGAEIRAYLKGTDGIGSRFEGNRFLIYCNHMKDCHVLYNRLQKKLMELTSSFDIRLDMGVMPWQKDTEPVQLFEQAHIACNLARKNSQSTL